ncbi:MAG TPA: tetratricopeptide repeat protein [Edaphobacter sp.]|nr:tetratricopeptide repeat protein [Edaphobacter sp.]
MNRIERKWSTGLGICLAFLLALATQKGWAQTAPASVHGHVNNAIGAPITKGEVKLTQDRSGDEKSRKYTNTFEIEPSGDFKGTGINPGSYLAVVSVDGKTVDYIDNVNFAAGEDHLLNFDMTRKEYIDKMTPEEKKQLEEFKKKNSEVMQANAKIANLNALLTQARNDTKAGNFDAAITAMQQATSQKPDEGILWVALGDAQLGSADAAAKAAKAAGKPADPAVQAKYAEAAASYKKAIDANAASKKPNVETAAAAYNQMGQALAKSGDGKGASDAYEQAAKAKPDSAGMYYYNEAATLYNAGKLDDAAVAADKAIAADPKRADAYYIKGQALIPKATVDPKTQKIVAPPGCVEAYQDFIELASSNPAEQPRVEEVKGILQGIGAEIKSSYKAGRKK